MAILTITRYASLVHIKHDTHFVSIYKRKNSTVALQTVFAIMILSYKLFSSVCES